MTTRSQGIGARGKSARRSSFVRSLALFVLLLLASSLLSCIGIPIKHRRVNHIIATGWDRDGKPIALVQRVRLSKWAWALSPEGPGLFESCGTGPFFVLRDGEEIRLGLDPPGAKRLSAHRAAARTEGDGFLLLYDAEVSAKNGPRVYSYHCALIGPDASVSECRLPEGLVVPWPRVWAEILPGGREVRWEPESENEEKRSVILEIETGKLRPQEDEFLTLRSKRLAPQDPGAVPCSPYPSRLSPQRSLWAIHCGLRRSEGWFAGIWLLDRSGEMRLVHQVSSGPEVVARENRARKEYKRTLEYMVTKPEEEYGLAWSPDQSRLYWCPGRYLEGAVISVDDRSSIPHEPCFVLPSWSPDGKRIVGVAESKIEVWEVPLGE